MVAVVHDEQRVRGIGRDLAQARTLIEERDDRLSELEEVSAQRLHRLVEQERLLRVAGDALARRLASERAEIPDHEHNQRNDQDKPQDASPAGSVAAPVPVPVVIVPAAAAEHQN